MGKTLRTARRVIRRTKDKLRGKLSRKHQFFLLHNIPVKGTVISPGGTVIRVNTKNSLLNPLRKLAGKEPVKVIKVREYDFGRRILDGKATYHIGKKTGKITKLRAKGSLRGSKTVQHKASKQTVKNAA